MPRGYNQRDEAQLQNRLWTPALLQPALWLDASDISTISMVGTGVSEWRDKSGNNRHATTTVRRPAFLNNALNGFPVINFTASSATKLDTPDFSIAPNRQFCSFGVASGAGLISSGNYPRIWVTKSTGDSGIPSNAYPQGYFGTGATNGSVAMLAGASTPLTPEITGISTTLPVLISGRFGTAGLASNNLSVAVNGGEQTTVSGRTGGLSTTGIRVGSDVGTLTVSSWNSWIGEIILTQNISFSESQLIEAYLAWKWGIPLFATHPYANRPPLIGD